MSHNVKLAGVRVTDLDILDEAIKKVAPGKARLDRTAKTFRTYRGQDPKCDAAIILEGSDHDIGLKADGEGGYELVFDPYALAPTFVHETAAHRCTQLYGQNAPTCATLTHTPGLAIGALTQEYGLMQAEYLASQQGYSTQRVNAGEGRIALEVMM